MNNIIGPTNQGWASESHGVREEAKPRIRQVLFSRPPKSLRCLETRGKGAAILLCSFFALTLGGSALWIIIENIMGGK